MTKSKSPKEQVRQTIMTQELQWPGARKMK